MSRPRIPADLCAGLATLAARLGKTEPEALRWAVERALAKTAPRDESRPAMTAPRRDEDIAAEEEAAARQEMAALRHELSMTQSTARAAAIGRRLRELGET